MLNRPMPIHLLRAARFLLPSTSSARVAARLFRRGTAARNAGRFLAAATLYEEALLFTPGLPHMHVQAGHMFKEAGDFESAEHHYGLAESLCPGDADLALQFGHLFKISGRLDDAIAAYRKAVELDPALEDAHRELAALQSPQGALSRPETMRDGDPALTTWLVPELQPTGRPGVHTFRDTITIRRLGARREYGPWGLMKTLRAVESIRGHCIASVPVLRVDIVVDQVVVHTSVPEVHDLPGGLPDQRKYTFNIWLDVSGLKPGQSEIEVRCIDARERVRIYRQHVVIAKEHASEDPASDASISAQPDDPRSIDEQINTRASMVRSARRTLFGTLPRTVLVQRVDQLGDLAVSIPAIRRLRAMLPDARIVGLLSPANVDLGRTLKLFDEIVVADFPETASEGRRTMTAFAQKALAETLAPYRFDLAIDLCENGGSRPLLLLSGATRTYGFRANEATWLTADVTGSSHDSANGLESLSHMNKLTGLIEWLGGMLEDRSEIIVRPDIDRVALEAHGLMADDTYAVLHMGARLPFSRWPHFLALAAMLLQHTDLAVVLLADEPIDRALLPEVLQRSDRVCLIGGRMHFDAFDALLSFSHLFVGNDSGPKHLAALRGTRVVSLHVARLNWNEWGQNGTGSIVSRKVPCAGCGIHSELEECAKGFSCIVNIRPEEVFHAAVDLLDRETGNGTAPITIPAAGATIASA